MKRMLDDNVKWTMLSSSLTSEELATAVERLQKEDFGVIVCVRKSEVLEGMMSKVKNWEKVAIATDLPKSRKLPASTIQDAHAAVRKFVEEKASKQAARRVRIIYGGVLTLDTTSEYIDLEDVDGF